MSLFFLGDDLGVLVFPRVKDSRRNEKLLQSVILPLAAWGFFLVFRALEEVVEHGTDISAGLPKAHAFGRKTGTWSCHFT